jgi:two-component system, OmpR family, response regulator
VSYRERNAVQARKGVSLLLINSDAPLRDSLHDALKQRGHTVHTAADLAEALAVLLYARIEIILLDVSLPGKDAHRLCTALRTRSRAPIIMMSAAARPEDIARGYSAGADDYICKPFPLREVERHIQLALRRMPQASQR